MKTTYTNFSIKIENFFGDDLVIFDIVAHQGDNWGDFSVFFHELDSFILKHYPEEGKYIQQIRKSIGGYGPKEEEILNVLTEENFDLEKYVIAFIENKGFITEEIKRQNKVANLEQSDKEKEEFEDFIAKLDALIPKNPINNGKFLDVLEQVILKHLIDNYPELTNAEPEDIENLHKILSNYIPKLGYDLIDHIEDIRGRES